MRAGRAARPQVSAVPHRGLNFRLRQCTIAQIACGDIGFEHDEEIAMDPLPWPAPPL